MKTELYAERSDDKSVIVPDGIEILTWCYNSSPSNIEEVSLPSSLINIDNSFCNCVKLRKIIFRDGVNPNLKISKGSFEYVFHEADADQIFEMDAPDIILVHIFKHHFIEGSIVQMKRKALLAYLGGKKASGKLEDAIVRFAKKDYANLFFYFCCRGDAELFTKYLMLYKPDKNTYELMSRSLEKAKEYKVAPFESKVASIESAITDYLDKHYKPDESKRISEDVRLKKLGLKERSIAEWKKIFKLRETEQGYVIVRYLDEEKDVIIPEMIGEKPVIAFEEGAFSGLAVTSIKSKVSPFLRDFFDYRVFPSLNIYGQSELKKKRTVYDLNKAKVNQCVLFGSYPVESEEGTRQPIVWRVLKKEENSVLLASLSVIEKLPMNAVREKTTWEQCGMRRWLNELFYNFAFSDEEKSKILKTKLINSKNPEYGTPSGNDTEDYVFLFSIDEVKALSDNALVNSRESTDYACTYHRFSWYRTNGKYRTYFATVIDNAGEGCDEYRGVRPVIWVKIEN